MFKIKTKDNQESKPDINVPINDVFNNPTNNQYVNNNEYHNEQNNKITDNTLQTKSNHRYFNFKIKTKYFKNDTNIDINVTYKPSSKSFEISKDQYTNQLNIYTIITSYLIIKRLYIPQYEFEYNLTKELFFKGDLIDENNVIFRKHLLPFIETLPEYDIIDYFDKKELVENNENIKFSIEIMFNLFEILFKKVKTLKDKNINEITLNLCKYYINFVNSSIKIILQLKKINTDNLRS